MNGLFLKTFKFFGFGFILAGFFLFLPLAAQAASYYVDFTLGGESNAGTQAAPLKFHPWMASSTAGITLQAGDTIYMKRGEQWIGSGPTTPWMTVGQSGSSGNYITTTAYGSGAQPLIKINTNSNQVVIYGAGKSFIKFDNLHIQHYSGDTINPNLQDGIQFAKSGTTMPHDWVITNNEIDNIPGAAIQGFDDSYNITIGDPTATATATQTGYSNHIHNFGYAGITLLGRNSVTGRSDFNVYYNYVHDAIVTDCGTNEYGIMFTARNGSSGWPAYATAKYNRVENITGWEGLDVHSGSYIYFQNNYVKNTMMGIMAGAVDGTGFGVADAYDHYYIDDNIIEKPADQRCNISQDRTFVVISGDTPRRLTNIYVRNNKIFFTTRPSDNLGQSGISVGGVDGIEISGNEFYNGSTIGAMAAVYSHTRYGNVTIKNNYVHDWYLRGFTFDSDSNMMGPVEISNNIVASDWGVSFRTATDIPQSVNIYNNILMPGNNYGVITEGDQGVAAAGRLNIKNNIFMSSSMSAGLYYIYIRGATNNNLLIDNNLYFNSTAAKPFYMGADIRTWAQFQTLGYDASGFGSNTNPLLTNTTGNYSAATDFVPLWNSPVIDAGTTASSTTDHAGNNLYGTTDIGPYEYQPPYTMGTDNVDSSSTVRVYANGKYRNTNTPSGTTVGLVVTPTGGFGSGTYTAYMDIKINTWNTTSTMFRKWTESNTSANNTVHTVKNLTANKYYTVWYTKDGSVKTRLTAVQTNASGEATFTYNQGYSTVVLEMIEDVTQPASFSITFPQNGNSTASTRPTLSWGASSDSESGLAKYQLYIDNTLDTDNISSAATSVATTVSLSCSSHSWYVKALDYAGNTTSTPSASFTVTCATGGISGSTGAGGWSTPPPPVVTPTSTLASVTSTPALATMVTSTPSLAPFATSTVVGKTVVPSLAKKTTVPVTVSRISPPLIQQIPANFKFIFNLGYGRRSQAVRYLQMFLAAQPEEFYSKDKLSYWFGPMTYRAVARFQEKYKTEILAPLKLKRGTGFVGVKTREVINKMLGN